MTIVPGFGPRNAKLMFVGEAPSFEEERQGKPFVGPAGEELNRLFGSAQINREEVYITNASLERVTARDKDEHFFNHGRPTDVYVQGITQLVRDIQEIQPNVVVPLGNYALWALTTLDHIMDWRGSIIKSPLTGTKLVPTIHPAALIHRQSTEDHAGGLFKYRSPVIWDLVRAREQSLFPEFRYRPRNIIIDPKGVERDEAVHRLLQGKVRVFDYETFGGTNLACCGFSDGDPEWAVVFLHKDNASLALFKMLLEDDTPKWGQNLMYDATLGDQVGINVQNIVFDTMLAQHVLLVELPKGLDFMTSIYTDIPYYKHEGKVWNKPKTPELLMQFWNYNGKDVCATTEIVPQQTELLHERGLWDVFQREMACLEPLRRATGRGFRVDLEGFRNAIDETEKKRTIAQLELDVMAGYEVNANSHVQVKELIYERRNLPKRYKGGKLTSDARALHDLGAKEGDPILDSILKVRSLRKMLSNYYTEKILSPDGRVRSNYNIGGTTSGRLSSDAPLWGVGVNGQNQPPEQRRFFIADEGYELAEFDQSQAEAIVTAYLADDPVHIDCFRTGKDVHRVTACLMLGRPADEWESIPKKSPIRDLYKRANHAFNYEMGPDTFMLVNNQYYDPEHPDDCIVLDQRTARQFSALYLRMRPALSGYWEGIRSELRSNKTLVSPLGRVRIFLDQWSDTLCKSGYAFKPQSTVGDITNIALARTMADDRIRKLDVQLLAQVHDSIVFQWPKNNRDAVMSIIWPLLETEIYVRGYRIVIPWEGMVGDRWDKNLMQPLGMSRKCPEVGYN